MRQEEHEKALPVPVHALHTTPMERNGSGKIFRWASKTRFPGAGSSCGGRTRFSCGREKTEYVHGAGCVITINADSYTIITAHPERYKREWCRAALH